MRGLPKYFATKQDYLNCLAVPELAEPTKEKLTSLAEDRFIWVTTEEVASLEAGVTDETHRVIEAKDAEEKAVFLQQEYVEDENAEVFRLGFTLEEVADLTK